MVLVAGTGQQAERFIYLVSLNREWNIDVVGVVSDAGENTGSFCGVAVLGNISQLSQIIHVHVVDRVIFFPEAATVTSIQKSLYQCELEGIDASVALGFFDRRIANMRLEFVGGVPFIAFETTHKSPLQRALKRIMDVVLSGLGIFVLSPFLLFIALLIKLTSPGPILFAQPRMGLHGRVFTLYKFRSMYRDAEERLAELQSMNEADGPVFKIRNDPRITSVGKLMRKLSIDELPQLLNVFAGDMSLVGPRPPLPSEVSRYETWHRRRLSVRPGLTCLWQISGRSDAIDFHEWMRLDLKYLDNWSIWLDIRIILRTIPAVFLGKGAY